MHAKKLYTGVHVFQSRQNALSRGVEFISHFRFLRFIKRRFGRNICVGRVDAGLWATTMPLGARGFPVTLGDTLIWVVACHLFTHWIEPAETIGFVNGTILRITKDSQSRRAQWLMAPLWEAPLFSTASWLSPKTYFFTQGSSNTVQSKSVDYRAINNGITPNKRDVIRIPRAVRKSLICKFYLAFV